MRQPLVPFLVLAVVIAGCATPTAKPTTPATTAETSLLAPKLAPSVSLTGMVTAPAAVVAAGGGNVVAAGGGNVVAAGGGNVVAAGGLNYRIQEADEAPLVDAEVYLANGSGERVRALGSVRTDAQGHFSLPRVPDGYTFKVVVLAKDASGDPVALQTLVKTKAGASCEVSGASTLVAETISEGRAGALGEFNAQTFKKAVDAARDALKAAKAPKWSDKAALRKALAAIAETVPTLKEAIATLKVEVATVQAQRQQELDKALGAIAAASPPPSAAPGLSEVPLASKIVVDAAINPLFGTPEGMAIVNDQMLIFDGTKSTYVGVNLEDDAIVNPLSKYAQFAQPGQVSAACVDAAGNVYITLNHNPGFTGVYRFAVDGTQGKFAGSDPGFADGSATTAQFNNPAGIGIDDAGNLYVADAGNHCIRKVTPSGDVTTIAGTNAAGYVDGSGRAARFDNPRGILASGNGKLFVADAGNNRIRRVGPDGNVSTHIGQGGSFSKSTLRAPEAVAVDPATSGFIVADTGNGRVLRVLGDGSDAVLKADVPFKAPVSLLFDKQRRLWVGDRGAARVVRLTL